MRTTVNINERLLERVKEAAAKRKVSVSRVIEDGLHLYLRPEGRNGSRPRLKMVTFGGGGTWPVGKFDQWSAMLEQEDIERFGQKV